MIDTCNNCMNVYWVSCEATPELWGRQLQWRLHFHWKHSIEDCKADLHLRLFITALSPLKRKKWMNSQSPSE